MMKIFADRDYVEIHIFVACTDSFLLKDSFAAQLSLLVKFHPLLNLNTTSIFASPIKNIMLFKFSSLPMNPKIKEYYLLCDCNEKLRLFVRQYPIFPDQLIYLLEFLQHFFHFHLSRSK